MKKLAVIGVIIAIFSIISVSFYFLKGTENGSYNETEVLEIRPEETDKHYEDILGDKDKIELISYEDHTSDPNGIVYARSRSSLYCLIMTKDGATPRKELVGIDVETARLLTSNVIKDRSAVYHIRFCSRNSVPEIDRFVPDDIDTFNILIKTKEGMIFSDKYYLYSLLPQEYIFKKIAYLDRNSVKFIGYGKERSIELVEDMTATTTNAYLSDMHNIYMMEFGNIINIGTSTNFSIPQFEKNKYDPNM